MIAKNSVLAIPMTSHNVADFDGSFKVINTDGLDEACDMLRITNDSDVDVTISYDGTNSHDFCLLGQVLQLPTPIGRSNFAKGTKVYVEGRLENREFENREGDIVRSQSVVLSEMIVLAYSNSSRDSNDKEEQEY